MPASGTPRIMSLTIQEVVIGAVEKFENGVLTIDKSALQAIACEDPRVAECQVNLVKPGQNTRMVHVLDSFRPICSVEGPAAGAFPGISSDPTTMDMFDVVELDGVFVTMVGQIPPVDSFLTQHEGILDMMGPGAALSPVADNPHVVLALVGKAEITSSETSRAFRGAAVRVAEHLASLALPNLTPPHPPNDPSADRPNRLVHICEVSAFGEMFNTLVAGVPVIGMLPIVISESAMRAGAVVSADYHYAGQRNYTCFYQRNPVAEAVRGTGMQLAGTILLPVGGDDRRKGLGAAFAAHLASKMKADGAVITAVAGGNAHLDVMFAVRECESRGIRSVLSLVEMAGPDGNDPGMVDTVPEADLIVSTGNREAIVELPPALSVIGGPLLFEGPPEEGGGAPSDGALLVPLRTIVGANNEMGAWKLGALVS